MFDVRCSIFDFDEEKSSKAQEQEQGGFCTFTRVVIFVTESLHHLCHCIVGFSKRTTSTPAAGGGMRIGMGMGMGTTGVEEAVGGSKEAS